MPSKCAFSLILANLKLATSFKNSSKVWSFSSQVFIAISVQEIHKFKAHCDSCKYEYKVQQLNY